MQVFCPTCGNRLPAASMNVAADTVVCGPCDEAFELSDLLAGGYCDEAVDLDNPPDGAWFREDFDGWEVGTTMRSGLALFLIPFTCVWSGMSIGFIYGKQIAEGQFDLRLSLFGIPFLIGTCVLGLAVLMTTFGKVMVRVSHGEGSVFLGAGALGWRRRFDWNRVEKIDEVEANYRENGRTPRTIALVGEKTLRFGTTVSEARRKFLLGALRQMLRRRRS